MQEERQDLDSEWDRVHWEIKNRLFLDLIKRQRSFSWTWKKSRGSYSVNMKDVGTSVQFAVTAG